MKRISVYRNMLRLSQYSSQRVPINVKFTTSYHSSHITKVKCSYTRGLQYYKILLINIISPINLINYYIQLYHILDPPSAWVLLLSGNFFSVCLLWLVVWSVLLCLTCLHALVTLVFLLPLLCFELMKETFPSLHTPWPFIDDEMSWTW